MKNIFYCMLISSVFFLSCTINKPVEKPKFITVTASATITENADYAIVTFPVNASGWIAAKVIEDNIAASNRISQALQTAGVGADDISVSNYGFEPYRIDTRQYSVSNNVTAKIHNLNSLGQIIDTAKLPGSPIPDVEFKLSDLQGAFRRARTMAVQKAQEKSSLFTGAGGCKIGELLSLEEINVVSEDNIKAGKNGIFTITSELRVTYSIQ
ncbi:MAG: SIMPL domain-containing protein [Treponema sp.]